MKLRIPAAAVLALGASAHGAIWTVDDSGGSNFTNIQAAVNASVDGDVILVKPGNYAAFTITGKSLGILGVPDGLNTAKPWIVGKATINSVTDSTLAHLKINSLEFIAVSGTGVVDDVDAVTSLCELGCSVTSCPRMIFSRCQVQGKMGDFVCETPGLFVTDSTVNVSLSSLIGGDGGTDGCWGYPGHAGLVLGDDSTVLLAQTEVRGGSGGNGGFDCGPGGNGSSAIHFQGIGSSCIVRGNSNVSLESGFGGSGLLWGTAAQYAVDGTGAFSISEVLFFPPALGPGIVETFPALRQPFFTMTGGDAPGSAKTFSVYAVPGSSHFVFVTVGYPLDYPFLSQLDGPLYLALPGPLAIFPMTASGQYAASSVSFTLPNDFTGLEGVIATFQGLSQGFGSGGEWLAGNPVPLVIR